MRVFLFALVALTAFLVAWTGYRSLSPAPREVTGQGEQAEVVVLINEYRADNGLSPLMYDERLADVAQAKAADMAENNYFAHSLSLEQAFQAAGYPKDTLKAEILAAGVDEPMEALQLWQGSESHDNALLLPLLSRIGVGFAMSEQSDHLWYWAVEMGSEEIRTVVVPTSTPTPLVVPPTKAEPECKNSEN